jgi:uncharacterized delta-60 repeat protein
MKTRQNADIDSKKEAGLDPSFGDNGTFILPHPSDDTSAAIYGIATLPDNSILVGLEYWLRTRLERGIAKLRPDGTFDTTFGNNGILTDPEMDGRDTVLRPLPDGRLLVRITKPGPESFQLILRLKANGVADGSFANLGILALNFDGHFLIDADIVLLADGHFVLLGAARRMTDGTAAGGMIVRLQEDGELDLTLDGKGFVIVPFDPSPYEIRFSAVVQGDKYVLASKIGPNAVIRRYMSDGRLDTTFGVDGQYVEPDTDGTTDFTDLLYDDGHFVAIGRLKTADGLHEYGFLMGLDGDGRPDITFANGKPVYMDRWGSSYLDRALFDDAGRILVLGQYGRQLHQTAFVVARYTPNGALDESFGDLGVIALHSPHTREFRGFATQGELGILASTQFSYTGSGPGLKPFGMVMRMPHSPR